MVLVKFFHFIHFAFFKLDNKITVNYFYLGTGGRAQGGRLWEKDRKLLQGKGLGASFTSCISNFDKPVHQMKPKRYR